MKPLPNLSDDAAMAVKGRQSALGTARNEAAAELRDACTMIQAAHWDGLAKEADRAIAALERLKTLAAMWGEIGA